LVIVYHLIGVELKRVDSSHQSPHELHIPQVFEDWELNHKSLSKLVVEEFLLQGGGEEGDELFNIDLLGNAGVIVVQESLDIVVEFLIKIGLLRILINRLDLVV
jgi:hypothetical protein